MRYALGIDGGGSKCEAVLLEESGAMVGHGLGGPIHSYYDPPEVIRASFRDAVGQAVAGLSGAQIWAMGQVPPPEVLAEAVNGAGEVVARQTAREDEAGYATALESWGLVVLAGTGSFVHGRTQEGRELHFGGAGPVLGDYGSGYAIGLAGLRAAFASHWTAARRTSLVEAIPRALEVADLHGVFRLVYVEQINRRRIAALARAVDAEAEQGDAVAQQCVREAANALADTAVDLIHELALGAEPFPLIPMGSVARGSRTWWAQVEARIAEVAPRAHVVTPRFSPAVGAALLALREIGIAWTPAMIARLEASLA
jgi:N-acetylglucosamine kinase